MSIEAMKAIQMVYANTTKHDWPDDIWDAICQAIEAEKQEPKCVVIVEVFGKDWRLEYMSLPVGRHKLYAQQYLYTHPQLKHEPLLVFAKECVLGAYRESELADAAQRAIKAAERKE